MNFFLVLKKHRFLFVDGVLLVKMGIDISQWRSTIGNFGKKGKTKNGKSRQQCKLWEEMACKEIQQEVKSFWKNTIVIMSLLLAGWFFMVHSLPGEGSSETNIRACESRFFMQKILGGGRPIKVLPQTISFFSPIFRLPRP